MKLTLKRILEALHILEPELPVARRKRMLQADPQVKPPRTILASRLQRPGVSPMPRYITGSPSYEDLHEDLHEDLNRKQEFANKFR